MANKVFYLDRDGATPQVVPANTDEKLKVYDSYDDIDTTELVDGEVVSTKDTSPDGSNVYDYIDAMIDRVSMPVGAVTAFPLGTTHQGWLLCDGRDTTGTEDELLTHYPVLYTYLGNSNVLPDYRECTLVGGGQNDTDTIAAHDVYTLGEFKDDQLQNITGTIGNISTRYAAGAAGAFYQDTGSENYSTQGSTGDRGTVKFDASRVARTGTTTHGKQKGVAFYIKATSAGIEVDKDLYATKGYVNDAISYSTEEQLTGGKWIDGKPIYRKVILKPAYNTTLLTGVSEVVNYRVKRVCHNGTPQGYVYFDGDPSSGVNTSIYIDLTNNEVKINSVHGQPLFNAQWVVLEYTKTTD